MSSALGTPKFPTPSKSPGSRSALCFRMPYSKAPQKRMIWRPPATGNLDVAARPFGMSLNVKPLETERKPGQRKYSGTM